MSTRAASRRPYIGGISMAMGRNGVRAIGLVTGLLLLLAGLVLLWPVIMPFFLALLFAYLLQPLVRRLLGLEVCAPAAVVVVYLYFFLLIWLIISLCLPILTSQFSNLLDYLPQLMAQLRLLAQDLSARWEGLALPAFLEQALPTAGESLAAGLTKFLGNTANSLSPLLRWGLYAALTPFLAFYMLLDRGQAKRRLLSWAPVGERNELLRLSGDVDHLLRQFVLGYLLVSCAMALLCAGFYWAAGLDYALALGLIMGVANLIPYFGPFLGAAPAVVIALFQGGVALALLIAVGLVVLQQLEGSVITPKVMGDRVGLHPLTTIFAVLAGGWLFGVLGAILAVPLTAAGLLLAKYLWSRLVGASLPQ